MHLRSLIVLAGLALGAGPALAEPVLLISIDGLRPGEVTEAQQRGLAIPNLRRFLAEGTFATGVRGVLPTLTYPSHTTLITGTSPARHGIVANGTFDPRQINQGGWFWYASDIKVPTLWEAASRAGLTVGNVHWPVTVGAKGITWNLPQVWRTGHADDAKLLAALTTPGLLSELEADRGEPYAQGILEDIGADEDRGRFAVSLIRRHRPQFATVYFTAFDHQQHLDGPGTASAYAVLERIDAQVGAVIAAERKVHPDAVIALVSDHGFAAVDHETSLFRPFFDAGLIRLDKDGKVADWDAMPWSSGGSAAVVLARPDDAALRGKVADLLSALQRDPANGIAAVTDAAGIAAQRGNPQAAFYVDFAPGTSAANFGGAAAPLRAATHYKGTHGYFPAAPAMLSTFMMMGPHIPRGKSLGTIDMRAIAPTLARIMKARLDTAEVAPLAY